MKLQISSNKICNKKMKRIYKINLKKANNNKMIKILKLSN